MINGRSVLVVIPARMGGYRFPDKPLRIIYGKEMLRWVWENAKSSKYADEILIATPNKEIVEKCESFGAKVVMTSDLHRRGTERVYEAYRSTGKEWNIVVNFQGDEPLVTGEWLDKAIEELEANDDVSCVNLYKWMSYGESQDDQNEVKVVIDSESNALYFSRNALPAIWLGDKKFECRVEICVMPMWSRALEKFVQLPNAYYEEIESVDMMRFVENRMKVRMLECIAPVKSVDCHEDLIEAEKMLEQLHKGSVTWGK
jgi:3-deoxy-manno-octulosonate cytidylyltransferase (CMP-KDO synthetase)